MINTPPPPVYTDEAQQAEQATQQAVDHINMPSHDQPNTAVLAIADEYINKYRPLWQALAK